MKKVLLYYPQISGPSDSTTLYRGLPLSVLTIAAQIDAEKYNLRIIDGRVEERAIQQSLEWINKDTVCVGISAMTSYQIKDGLNLSKKIKEKNPDIKTVWGGWHPSLMPEETIENNFVDIVIKGQGEIVFNLLIEYLSEGKSINSIPDLYYKEGSNVIKTSSNIDFKLEDTKSVNNGYRYIDMEYYIQSLWGNDRILGYESSRGCPWNCRYCSISSVYKRKWDGLNAQRVVNEIEVLYKQYKIDALHFFDNNFFVDTVRVLEISRQLKDRGINIKWDGTTTVNQYLNFSTDYINKLKESGLYRVIIGVESGDEEVLQKIGKSHTNKQVIEIVKKSIQLRIQLSLSFMVGFPWNPEKDVKDTIYLIEEIKHLAPETEVLLFIFSPYLGTELYDVALEYGMVFPKSLEGWAEYTYDKVSTPWISQKLKRKIERYISFFGTKGISKEIVMFYRGGTEGGVAD